MVDRPQSLPQLLPPCRVYVVAFSHSVAGARSGSLGQPADYSRRWRSPRGAPVSSATDPPTNGVAIASARSRRSGPSVYAVRRTLGNSPRCHVRLPVRWSPCPARGVALRDLVWRASSVASVGSRPGPSLPRPRWPPSVVLYQVTTHRHSRALRPASFSSTRTGTSEQEDDRPGCSPGLTDTVPRPPVRPGREAHPVPSFSRAQRAAPGPADGAATVGLTLQNHSEAPSRSLWWSLSPLLSQPAWPTPSGRRHRDAHHPCRGRPRPPCRPKPSSNCPRPASHRRLEPRRGCTVVRNALVHIDAHVGGPGFAHPGPLQHHPA